MKSYIRYFFKNFKSRTAQKILSYIVNCRMYWRHAWRHNDSEHLPPLGQLELTTQRNN